MSLNYIGYCKKYDCSLIQKNIEQGLEITGITQKLKQDKEKNILLKPNLLTASHSDKPVITNPEFIRACIKVFKKYGKVYVYDSPALFSLERVLKSAGILNIIYDEEANLFKPGNTVFKKLIHKQGKVELVDLKDKFDIIVNLPKLKTHCQMGMTLAVKNCFGFVPGKQKAAWHFRSGKSYNDFADLINDICLITKPDINIIDGIVGMEGNGPQNGQPKSFNLIAIGKNAFELDIALSDFLGIKREQVYTIKQSLKNKIIDENLINTYIDDKILDTMYDVKMPEISNIRFGFSGKIAEIIKDVLRPYPEIISSKCQKCGECLNICPAGAVIRKKNGDLHINKKDCIECFACHENCRYDSIAIKKGLLANIIYKH